jgi:hypothetical protein
MVLVATGYHRQSGGRDEDDGARDMRCYVQNTLTVQSDYSRRDSQGSSDVNYPEWRSRFARSEGFHPELGHKIAPPLREKPEDQRPAAGEKSTAGRRPSGRQRLAG